MIQDTPNPYPKPIKGEYRKDLPLPYSLISFEGMPKRYVEYFLNPKP